MVQEFQIGGTGEFGLFRNWLRAANARKFVALQQRTLDTRIGTLLSHPRLRFV